MFVLVPFYATLFVGSLVYAVNPTGGTHFSISIDARRIALEKRMTFWQKGLKRYSPIAVALTAVNCILFS